MLLGVEQHAGADTVFAVGAVQHVDVDAAFAAAPEGLVVGQLGKSDGLVAQLGVHGHDGGTAGQREYLGVWPADAGQGERHVLDALGQA